MKSYHEDWLLSMTNAEESHVVKVFSLFLCNMAWGSTGDGRLTRRSSFVTFTVSKEVH